MSQEPPIFYKDIYQELSPYLDPATLRNLTQSAKYYHQHLSDFVKPEQAVSLLTGAIHQHSLPTVQRLVRDFSFSGPVLNRALIHAIQKEDPAITEFLLTAGADPNTDQGEPLRLALSTNQPSLVDSLLQHHANIKLLGDDALEDALGEALEDFHLNMVDYLLTKGIRLTDLDWNALINEYPDVYQIFLRHGITESSDNY